MELLLYSGDGDRVSLLNKDGDVGSSSGQSSADQDQITAPPWHGLIVISQCSPVRSWRGSSQI